MHQFQEDVFLTKKTSSRRTPKYHKVVIIRCFLNPANVPVNSLKISISNLDRVFPLVTTDLPDLTPHENILSHLQVFMKRLNKICESQLKRRNPLDKLLFFGKRVMSVNPKGVLKPKFEQKVRALKSQFKHFPDITMQLSILFETQIDLLSLVLDVFMQMCQFFYKFLQEDPPKEGTCALIC